MTFKDCATDCPEMVVIPAGSFAMGSTADESGHKPTEEPEHKVTDCKAVRGLQVRGDFR
jgi:formylglycine-generating enzyme required for sulfatase activity